MAPTCWKSPNLYLQSKLFLKLHPHIFHCLLNISTRCNTGTHLKIASLKLYLTFPTYSVLLVAFSLSFCGNSIAPGVWLKFCSHFCLFSVYHTTNTSVDPVGSTLKIHSEFGCLFCLYYYHPGASYYFSLAWIIAKPLNWTLYFYSCPSTIDS